ncbi:DNA-directed RNA polymerase specialized sigma subunit, sigma24 homolog [Microbacterium testaceum StLB037]|uniref:DNA-directed RNA polymerase specialized sigma subunit, sigma24 homolog n=1 Tax=Microbacterium testaceum (strain StLB037) TaxID=979556 RepID=E8N7I7_MICTS|nr:sigma-70 family RNA polymerase sigma factor [Microbacterium testaceum]BAJ73020.1 DNA-directed RNA polymerase specialized sigma subunit, sigma24 homolog [Microbacterium testaceum StLB037]
MGEHQHLHGSVPVSRRPDARSEDWATRVAADNGADLLRYFARRHPDDADDLLSETLAVIWRRRDHLPTNPSDARMWSFGVARNVSHRHRRGLLGRRRLYDALASEADVTEAAPADPSAAAERRERETDVRRAIGRLRATDRELIMLVHWDGFTLVDAAALLGLNASTARTRYGRAKACFVVHLEEHRSAPRRDDAESHSTRRRYGPGVQDA